MNIASFPIQASPAGIARLEPSFKIKLYYRIYSASLIVNICMF